MPRKPHIQVCVCVCVSVYTRSMIYSSLCEMVVHDLAIEGQPALVKIPEMFKHVSKLSGGWEVLVTHLARLGSARLTIALTQCDRQPEERQRFPDNFLRGKTICELVRQQKSYRGVRTPSFTHIHRHIADFSQNFKPLQSTLISEIQTEDKHKCIATCTVLFTHTAKN